jgi:hypothetical protein
MRFGPVVLACWIVGCGPPQTVNRVSSERGSGGAGGTGRMDARAGSGGAGSLVAGGSGGSTGGAVGTGGADGVGGAAGLGGSSPEAGSGIDNPGPTGGTGGSGGTGPIDAAMESTSSPMQDAALPPPDTNPPPDAPPMIVCPMPAADEGISSFESGLTSDRVGDRGGTPWTVLAGTLDPAMGITGMVAPATAPARCGSTTFLRFTGMANATRTPITRTLFRAASGSTAQFFNASAFKGLRMFLRSTGGGTVRIKVPDRNTALPGGVCMMCNDHFIIDLNVTAEWQLFTVAFAQLKQSGTGDPQPALASGALYSLEIVAPRAGASTAPFTLEVDDISFFR